MPDPVELNHIFNRHLTRALIKIQQAEKEGRFYQNDDLIHGLLPGMVRVDYEGSTDSPHFEKTFTPQNQEPYSYRLKKDHCPATAIRDLLEKTYNACNLSINDDISILFSNTRNVV